MSDNELDAELLGMVGGESDDEGDSRSISDSGSVVDQTLQMEVEEEPAKPSVEKVEEPQKRTKGVAQKVRGRRKKAKRRESIDEEILDLGDGSPSPGPSINAADASDVDAPGSPASLEDDGPIFPLEGKYHNAADREAILAMPEIQREEILAERAQQELKRMQDRQLKLALAASSANKQKRKAAAADLDDGGRRTRPKAEKAKSALDDYRRARELKGNERNKIETGRGGRKDKRSPSSPGSDRDADGESEVEWADDNTARGLRDEPPPTLKDFDRVRVGRTAFGQICFYPGFEEGMVGCFARVSIGVNRETGQNMYRMAQIKGFTEGKPYQLDGRNGKHFITDQYALVTQGNSTRPWPLSACSDSPFTAAEVDRYLEQLRKEQLRPPTRKFLESRLNAIHALLNIEWTDARLTEKFAKQRAMQRKYDPAHIARQKTEALTRRRLDAETSGDMDEVARCDAELAALANSGVSTVNGALRSSPAAMKVMASTNNMSTVHQDRMAQLNAKNRGKNSEEVRRALIEEKRKLALAREAAMAEAQQKAEAEAAKKKKEEEAKRLAVPRNDFSELFGEGSDISRAGTPLGGTPRRSRAGTPMNGAAVRNERETENKGGPIGTIRKKAMDDEIIGGMDLGIDVEI